MLIAKRKYEELRAENNYLVEQLSQNDEFLPFIALAQTVRDAFEQDVQDYSEGKLDSAEVGERAFRMVLDAELENANSELVREYENAHRQSLYTRLLDQVRAEDGENISKQVWERINSDKDLMVELQTSVRHTLESEARQQREETIAVEQQKIMEAEAERALMLDRLDVEFALNRRLELNPEVYAQLKPHDTLTLNFRKVDGKPNKSMSVTLRWAEDALGETGWVVEHDYNERHVHIDLKESDSGLFVDAGAYAGSLKTGNKNLHVDLLMKGEQMAVTPKRATTVALMWAVGSNPRSARPSPMNKWVKRPAPSSYSNYYYYPKEEMVLDSIDFEVRGYEHA